MSEPVIIVKSQGQEVGRCDKKCYDGIGRKCTCCCGGVNHGAGLKRAIRRSKNIYNAVIELHFSEAMWPLEIIRPRHNLRLFGKNVK